jgi:hypothetical protein
VRCCVASRAAGRLPCWSLTRRVTHLQVVECSGHQSAARQRAATLAAFRSGAARVLVASDVVTRGIDVEGVGAVINYDAPVYAKTWVANKAVKFGVAAELCMCKQRLQNCRLAHAGVQGPKQSVVTAD